MTSRVCLGPALCVVVVAVFVPFGAAAAAGSAGQVAGHDGHPRIVTTVLHVPAGTDPSEQALPRAGTRFVTGPRGR